MNLSSNVWLSVYHRELTSRRKASKSTEVDMSDVLESFQRKAREWRKALRDMMELPYAEAKKQIVGNSLPFPRETLTS